MSALDMFWAAPPVTRTLAASAFLLSIAVQTGLVSMYSVLFHISYFVKFPPQIWRLFSSFLITGSGLNIIFDTYFLYTYGGKLETGSPKFSKPGDFFMYVVFVWATILGLNYLITGGFLFMGALVLAFTYTSCQDERGQNGQFFIVTLPAGWIPYAMLLLTFVMAGPDAAKIQATGIVAAHLHDFLTRLWPTFGGGVNLFPTPAFVSRIFEKTEAPTTEMSGSVIGGARPAAATASGSDRGVLPESWRNRGSGHRLGGD